MIYNLLKEIKTTYNSRFKRKADKSPQPSNYWYSTEKQKGLKRTKGMIQIIGKWMILDISSPDNEAFERLLETLSEHLNDAANIPPQAYLINSSSANRAVSRLFVTWTPWAVLRVQKKARLTHSSWPNGCYLRWTHWWPAIPTAFRRYTVVWPRWGYPMSSC